MEQEGGRGITDKLGKWKGIRNRGIVTGENARKVFDSFYAGNPMGKKYHMQYRKKTENILTPCNDQDFVLCRRKNPDKSGLNCGVKEKLKGYKGGPADKCSDDSVGSIAYTRFKQGPRRFSMEGVDTFPLGTEIPGFPDHYVKAWKQKPPRKKQKSKSPKSSKKKVLPKIKLGKPIVCYRLTKDGLPWCKEDREEYIQKHKKDLEKLDDSIEKDTDKDTEDDTEVDTKEVDDDDEYITDTDTDTDTDTSTEDTDDEFTVSKVPSKLLELIKTEDGNNLASLFDGFTVYVESNPEFQNGKIFYYLLALEDGKDLQKDSRFIGALFVKGVDIEDDIDDILQDYEDKEQSVIDKNLIFDSNVYEKEGGARNKSTELLYVPESSVYQGVIVTNRYTDDVIREKNNYLNNDIDFVKIANQKGEVFDLNVITDKVFKNNKEVGYINDGLLYL